MIKIIPTWVWLSAIAVAGIGGLVYGELDGMDRVQDKWDIQKELNKAAAEKDRMFRGVTTSVTQTQVVEKIKTITVKGDTRVIYKDKFVPVDSGYLSGGFRLFFDASATDTIPDASKIADAAPVAVTDVAATIEYNHTQCHKAYALVEGWQEEARKQCALNPKGCPDE